MTGTTDIAQLQFAVAQQRCLFSFNRGDFARLHLDTIAQDEHHFGIILSPQHTVGVIVRRLAALMTEHTADDLLDQLVWLKAGT